MLRAQAGRAALGRQGLGSRAVGTGSSGRTGSRGPLLRGGETAVALMAGKMERIGQRWKAVAQELEALGVGAGAPPGPGLCAPGTGWALSTPSCRVRRITWHTALLSVDIRACDTILNR